MRHLNSLLDLSVNDIERIFELATDLKRQSAHGMRPNLLMGKVLTQVFEKPSLRTRVSFEAAMMQLGGSSLFLNGKEAGLGGREAIQDIAKVLGSYSDVIVLRTFSQQLIDDFVRYAGCHVVNGLSDLRHPCQALTDLFTMREIFGDVRGKKFVYVGDGNNVATSLATATALLGVPFVVCAPEDYRLPREFLNELAAAVPGASVEQSDDFPSAMKDAAVIYTDVWTSMGQEAEDEERKQDFADYQVDADMLKLAPKTCKFMHCLPAKRGKEVTDEVIDGPQSIVFQQAENRMHFAKGLLVWLLEAGA